MNIETKADNVTQIQTPILSAFYGQNEIPPGTNLTWLRELDTDEFLRRTYSGKTKIQNILRPSRKK